MQRQSNKKNTEEDYDRIVDELFCNKEVALANALVQAREQTNLLESKIEFLAIHHLSDDMRTRQKKDAKGKPYDVHYVTLKASEIKNLMGRKGGSIYDQIAAAAIMLKQKLYIYREEDQFVMNSLYGAVEYKDGDLSIEFVPETEHLFMELVDNFTLIKLDIAFKFKTNGGFQLYKLLRSIAFKLPEIDMSLSQEEQAYIIKEYSLDELRLQLGYVNLNQPDIKREGAKKDPDVHKMNELEKKPKYRRWSDFLSRVIEPGVAEINKISDIYIDSVNKVTGAKGKVVGVSIKFQYNKHYFEAGEKAEKKPTKTKNEKKILSEDEIDDFIDLMGEFLEHDLKTREKKQIAETANYDIKRIETAYEILCEYEKRNKVESIAGFMIDAINKGYSKNTKGESPAGNKKNSFHNFNQREYSDDYYDDLEQKLLNI